MSIDYRQWFMCERKKRHHSERSANRAVARVAKEGHGAKNVYECPYCGWWHIGGQKVRKAAQV
jgi:hypothetical protein